MEVGCSMMKTIERSKQGKEKALPDGWQHINLGKIATFINGKAYKQRELLDKGIPVLRIQNLHGKDNWYYSDLKLAPEKYCDEGDLLFAWSTTFGPYIWLGPKVIYHYHIWRVIPHNTLDKDFAYYLLKSITNALKATSHGASMLHITKEGMEKWVVAIPPLDEQKRIVSILNDRMEVIAKARAATEAQLKAATALPAAYLRQIFDSPESQTWEMKRLGNIIERRTEIIHPKDEPTGQALFVGLEHVQSLSGKRLGSISIEMSKLTGRKPKFYRDDIVYGYLRPYLNKAWIAELDGLCSVDQYVYAVNTEIVNANFVAWFMRSPIYLSRAPIDFTPGQLPRIRSDEVASVEINLPDMTTQFQVVQRLDGIMHQVSSLSRSLQDQLNTINALPVSLLCQTFNGEL